jgi:hypothetical protein
MLLLADAGPARREEIAPDIGRVPCELFAPAFETDVIVENGPTATVRSF